MNMLAAILAWGFMLGSILLVTRGVFLIGMYFCRKIKIFLLKGINQFVVNEVHHHHYPEDQHGSLIDGVAIGNRDAVLASPVDSVAPRLQLVNKPLRIGTRHYRGPTQFTH